MADRLHGIDISNYQRGIDLAKTDAEFVLAKATEGTGYVDPYCVGFVNQAKKLGLPWGTYHFYAGGDGRAEADFYLKNIADYIGHGIMVLDFERNTGNRSEPKEFLDRVHERTGIWPILYISGSVATAGGWDSVAKNCGLWIARWGTSSPGATGPWDSAILWQYTDAHPTGGMKVDGDYFYGDKSTWNAYATGGKKPQPEPEPQPEPDPEKTTGDEFSMSEQGPTQTRTDNQKVPPDGDYHELKLENNGDLSFGFGGGRYKILSRFILSSLTAAEELMVRVKRFDTDSSKDSARIKDSDVAYWVVGLPGGGGKSYRDFQWEWHVPNPPKGRGRRLRIEAANFTDHDIVIEDIHSVTWKAPL